MSKVRDILRHVRVEQALRQRKCHRNKKHVIVRGEMCLVVRTNATNDDYSYSREASQLMLDAAWTKLKGLYFELGLTPLELDVAPSSELVVTRSP